ncbi:MAG: hypothetical protein L6R39_000618 [Caloplaca ligustica]|nr:MAG: hypothetical protein L6R39_000618 [Caloplaca ligustica]
MARRRHKKRTHIGAHNGPSNTVSANSSASRSPKTMVIRVGASEIGSSVGQLVKDVRRMMEPGTASRLKERKSNRLRDYTTMAGPLGVSHLLLFSKAPTGNTNLRLALLPRGPTLHFRIEKYSLCKDVQKVLRHAKSGEKEYLSPPLLVMNNFMTSNVDNASKPAVPKHLETLSTTIFQSLFPPISPQSTPLSSIRRVLLLNRELRKPEATASDAENHQYVLNVRHYAIVTKPTGLSKGVRRISAAERALKERRSKKNMPNLGKLADVADYILDPSAASNGFTSGSESEVETDAEVEVMDTHREKVHSKDQADVAHASDTKHQHHDRGTHKRAVKLVELGPRMKLRMTKAEEGVCGGKVMWHEYMHKSEAELQDMERIWEARKREKAERKRVQKENVERRKRATASGAKSVDGPEEALAEDNSDFDSEGWDSAGSEAEG